MIAVSDTSPICYLVLIGQADLLHHLFDQVVLSRAVLTELRHKDAPDFVRSWAAKPPSWIAVRENPTSAAAGMERLHFGERSAIVLAEAMEADIVLLDEKSARRVASDRGLRVTGTLGILGEAAARDLVDLAAAIGQLRITNFRYSPALLKAMLERFDPKAI